MWLGFCQLKHSLQAPYFDVKAARVCEEAHIVKYIAKGLMWGRGFDNGSGKYLRKVLLCSRAMAGLGIA